MASRTKGSGFHYTKEMSVKIFDIVKVALERTYGNKLIIQNPLPTPIVAVFSFIGAVKDGADTSKAPLSSFGIDPATVEKITVYGDAESLLPFTADVIGKVSRSGEDKEQKYYGNMAKTGGLVFDNALTPAGGPDRMVAAMTACGYADDASLLDKINVRGSQIRSIAQSCDEKEMAKFLPNFLNSKEVRDIIDIMQGHSRQGEVLESLIRSYICEVIR